MITRILAPSVSATTVPLKSCDNTTKSMFRIKWRISATDVSGRGINDLPSGESQETQVLASSPTALSSS